MFFLVQVWDLQVGKCVAVLRGHVSAVTSVSFSGDRNLMIRWDLHVCVLIPRHVGCGFHMNIIVYFCMTCFHGPLSVGLVAVVNARASPVYTRSLTGSLTSSLCVGRETHSLRYNSSHNYLYI